MTDYKLRFKILYKFLVNLKKIGPVLLALALTSHKEEIQKLVIYATIV